MGEYMDVIFSLCVNNNKNTKSKQPRRQCSFFNSPSKLNVPDKSTERVVSKPSSTHSKGRRKTVQVLNREKFNRASLDESVVERLSKYVLEEEMLRKRKQTV